MLSLPSQLVLRNKEHFENGDWAFINPTEGEVFNQIDNTLLIGLHQYYHHYQDCCKTASQSQYFSAAFNADTQKLKPLDGAVIYMAKSKQQFEMLVQNAAQLIKPNGVLLVVGENKAGIKSVPKVLEKVGVNVNKIDSAKHCGIYAVTIETPATNFNIDDYAITRTYPIGEYQVKIFSLPGVFGHKQLDPATALLIEQFSNETLQGMKGELYDFACGTGVIGCYFMMAANKYHSRLKLTMSDVSALAIYCSEKTTKLNAIEANIVPSDGFVQQYKRFDHIVTNPPFHDGIKNDYMITENFIKQAFSGSNPYANMTLVANSFLPYPNILEAVYGSYTEVTSSNKYRVYSVTKLKTKASK